MTDFEKWKSRYEKRWATKNQLKQLVSLQVLTEKEYEIITGDVYTQ